MRGMRLSIVVMASFLAGGNLLGGGKDDGELKKIQGTWRYVSAMMEGKPATPEQLAKMTITFTGDKWAVKEDGKLIQGGTHKIDASKKPAHVDAVVTEGQGKGDTMMGIYERKDGTIKVCFDPVGKARPTSFTPKAGEFAAVIERHKK